MFFLLDAKFFNIVYVVKVQLCQYLNHSDMNEGINKIGKTNEREIYY